MINVVGMITEEGIVIDHNLSTLIPAVSKFSAGSQEVVMKKNRSVSKPDYGCDSRCVYEYVECIDKEDGASICKTRERNCLDECPL